MPALPLMAAVKLTAASGALVPKATIVSPMTICGTLNFIAILELASTKISAPFINKTKPKTTNNKFKIILILSFLLLCESYDAKNNKYQGYENRYWSNHCRGISQ